MLVHFQFALPNHYYLPAEVFKAFVCPLVALDVLPELLFPEVDSGLGHVCVWTSAMPMPETSVQQDDCPVLREYDIRTSWKAARVQTEPKTESVQH
jgi:hypothetical protein